MDKETERTLIMRSPLFTNVSREGMNEILEKGVNRSVEEEGYYFLQGDPATHAYILLEGRVKMMQVTPNGQQLTLRIITPGQAFGGIALLQPAGGYPTTAIAVEDSTAKAWNTDFLRHLAEREPSLPMNVMVLMHSYITDLQERHQAMVEQRVEQRIARVLIKLAAQTGIKTTEGVLINIRITRQDIAEMGGTTLFSVSRTLNEWERNGLVRIGRERVLIRDPHKLVMILENHL